MPSISIPSPLRSYVDGQAIVQVNGLTVGAALEDLLSQFPAFRPHLCKMDGTLRSYANLFLDGTNIKQLNGLDTFITPDAKLILVPSIAGG